MLLRSRYGGRMTDQERTRWTKLVADYETSELTQREFASERGVSFSNLRNWIYKLRKETRPLVADETKVPRQEAAPAARDGDSRLVPVRVVASAAKRRTASTPHHDGESVLELVLP